MNKYSLIIIVLWLHVQPASGQGLTGPAYAAQKKAELRVLQQKNARRRATTRSAPTGPAYAAAQRSRLHRLQQQNAQRPNRKAPTGPAYANQIARIKANQRFFNGTWRNNNPYYSRPTVRIKGPYTNTPAFRSLNDPWTWGSQSNNGYWSRWRY